MKIAVASGKGGTGKTTVSTSLALSLRGTDSVRFIDCDVEAPNAHIFLKPDLQQEIPAVIRIPKIDPERCTLCGKCVEVCQFHALAKVGKTIMVFPQLCHGCGSCTWNCPEGAIEEIPNPIGVIEIGKTPTGIDFSHGKLTLSEPMATPIIRQLKKLEQSENGVITILDAPPGASCSVVETLRGVDFALLVTEPTPFGLHDLQQMLGILEDLKIPFGVVINRVGIGNDEVERFLNQNNIPVLMKIPFDKQIAQGIAAGKTLIEIKPEYQNTFIDIFQEITQIVKQGFGEQ
ncbi:MAG TPA: ATP-binding protein [Anaerolineaceae bacterium]|nr:ATP-binding protein [Anaerolineaceae bacterium]